MYSSGFQMFLKNCVLMFHSINNYFLYIRHFMRDIQKLQKSAASCFYFLEVCVALIRIFVLFYFDDVVNYSVWSLKV